MVRKSLALGVFLLLLTFAVCGASAMGKMEVTQDELLVVPYYSNAYYGYVYAQVTNTGDKPVEFNSGLVELFDPDSNILASSNIYDCYPTVLQPGEVGYVYSSSYVETTKKENVADFMLTVTGKGTISYDVVRLACTGRYEQVADSYYTYDYLVAEIKNTTGKVLTSGEVVFVMKDAAGAILYITSSYWSWYDIGLMPDSSVEVRVDLDSSISTYLKDNGITPASVEAIAYIETYK